MDRIEGTEQWEDSMGIDVLLVIQRKVNPMNDKFINKIILRDAEKILHEIKDDSIDLVLTDPPYFLDKMDNGWDPKTVSTITDYCHVVNYQAINCLASLLSRFIPNLNISLAE